MKVNAYLDLMIVAHGLLVIASCRFMNTICAHRIKKRGIAKLFLATFLSVFCIYFPWWISCTILLALHVLLFFLFFKKAFIQPCLAYLFCYYGLAFAMSIITDTVEIYRFIFVVHRPIGMLTLLVIPVFFFILYGVTKAVDALYHLKNYRMDAILFVNREKAKFRCYFDTGNTLKYQGIPVIFCLKDAWPFQTSSNSKKTIFSTLGEESEVELLEALLSYTDQDEKAMVYVALVDRKEDFNGCECLLNAYLK